MILDTSIPRYLSLEISILLKFGSQAANAHNSGRLYIAVRSAMSWNFTKVLLEAISKSKWIKVFKMFKICKLFNEQI